MFFVQHSVSLLCLFVLLVSPIFYEEVHASSSGSCDGCRKAKRTAIESAAKPGGNFHSMGMGGFIQNVENLVNKHHWRAVDESEIKTVYEKYCFPWNKSIDQGRAINALRELFPTEVILCDSCRQKKA